MLREFLAHIGLRIVGQPTGRVGVQRAVPHRPGPCDRVGQQLREQVGRRDGTGKPWVVGRAGSCAHGVLRIRQQEPTHRFRSLCPPLGDCRPDLRVGVGRQPGAQICQDVIAFRQLLTHARVGIVEQPLEQLAWRALRTDHQCRAYRRVRVLGQHHPKGMREAAVECE